MALETRSRALRRPPSHLTVRRPVVEIRHLLSHGKQVVAEGTLTREGSDERFVHIITFSGHGKSAGISEVLTYRA